MIKQKSYDQRIRDNDGEKPSLSDTNHVVWALQPGLAVFRRQLLGRLITNLKNRELNVVELGSGYGHFSRKITSQSNVKRFTAIEFSRTRIRFAERNKPWFGNNACSRNFIHANIEDVTFDDLIDREKLNLFVLFGFLHELPKDTVKKLITKCLSAEKSVVLISDNTWFHRVDELEGFTISCRTIFSVVTENQTRGEIFDELGGACSIISPRVDDVSMVVSNIEMKNIFMELRPSATKKVLRQIVKRIGKINGSWRKNF